MRVCVAGLLVCVAVPQLGGVARLAVFLPPAEESEERQRTLARIGAAPPALPAARATRRQRSELWPAEVRSWPVLRIEKEHEVRVLGNLPYIVLAIQIVVALVILLFCQQHIFNM